MGLVRISEKIKKKTERWKEFLVPRRRRGNIFVSFVEESRAMTQRRNDRAGQVDRVTSTYIAAPRGGHVVKAATLWRDALRILNETP
jgi:hypothetical protein